MVRNKMVKEYLRKEAEGASLDELERMTLGALRKAVVEGDTETGSIMAGQIAGLVKEEYTCKELITKLVNETQVLLKGTGLYE